MSYRNGPKIVSDGLVLYVDAGNIKSYTSGSTTWSDLSKNGNTATLTNGPTFSNTNGGNIVFDGVNDYCSLGSNFYTSKFYSNNQAWTIMTLINITQDKSSEGGVFCNQRFQSETDNSGPAGFGLSLYNGYCINMTYDNGNGTYTSYERHTTMPILTNTWDCVCYTWNPTTNTVTAYRNGNVYTTNTNASYKWSPRAAGTSAAIGVNIQGGWSTYYPMNIACVLVYNTALTLPQVRQNCNAIRTRFGL